MKRTFAYTTSVLVFGLIAGACSDDDGDGTGGSGGMAGSGTAGSAGAGGSGMAGTAGSAGSGMAGSGSSGSAQPMTFFVSSTGEDGGNFGGLEGADAFCDELATAVGAGDRTWRAFLSTNDVDARTRIGDGPWHNADGALVAEGLEALFANGVPVDADNAMNAAADTRRLLLLDETGAPVSADPLQHDILTGSDQAGNRITDQNCAGWTSNATDVTGQVGHSDSRGPQGTNTAMGWVSTHASQGCSAAALVMSGGSGRIYCFAAD